MIRPVWARNETYAMNSLELVEYVVHLKNQLDVVRKILKGCSSVDCWVAPKRVGTCQCVDKLKQTLEQKP